MIFPGTYINLDAITVSLHIYGTETPKELGDKLLSILSQFLYVPITEGLKYRIENALQDFADECYHAMLLPKKVSANVKIDKISGQIEYWFEEEK